MAKKPWAVSKEKPTPPTLPRDGAVNEKDRTDRKAMWDNYDFDLKSWTIGQAGGAASRKAREQQKSQEKKIEDSYGPMKELVRKQKEAEDAKAKAKTPVSKEPEAEAEEKPIDQSGLGGLGKKRNTWA